MAFKIIIKPIAIADIDEIISYYKKESVELGERFYHHFLAAQIKIQTRPLSYSYIKKPVRKYNIPKFPYKVFYLIENKNIFVLGVTHAKRSNAFVRRRLKLLK